MTIHQSTAETMRYIGYMRAITAAIADLREAEDKLRHAETRLERARAVVANTPGALDVLAALRGADAAKMVQSHE